MLNTQAAFKSLWSGVMDCFVRGRIVLIKQYVCKVQLKLLSNRTAFLHQISSSVQVLPREDQYCVLLWWDYVQTDCTRIALGYFTKTSATPWHLFTKRTDVSSQHLVKSRSQQIRVETISITLKFNRRLGSSAREMSVKFAERYDHGTIQSRGFEASRDLTARRASA